MADLSVKKTAASPWDEELPEEVEKNAKPTVVGDLDGGKNNVGTNVTPAINNQPSENVGEAKPLTVPAEVTEEVGAKVPAEEIVDQTAEMTADVPVAVPPTPEPIKPTTPSSDIKMPPTIRQTANVGVSTAPTINDRSPDRSVGASVGAAAPVVSQTPAPEPSTPNFDHLFAPVANPTPIAPASANPNQTVPAPSAQSSSANQADEEVKVLGKKFKVKNLIFGIVIVIILFFTIGVFLTEDGIISIGLEKIYGAVNLQSLWGGLPENSETALAISANQMKSESNFQISGTATVTANAGIKSNIVGPLVAGIVSSISSQSSQANVSELDATISAGVSGDVTGADLGIKSAANQKTKMNLIYAKNRMYVKTTDDISYDANSASGWVYWDLANPPAGGPAGDIFSGNYSGSTFSASGSRVGNEIVDGVHCYHYQANINLGDLLDSFGLTSSSVESIDSNFWIGVKDKRLHQITMKIIPGKSSALTRIDLTLNLNNFGAGGGNYIIPATATPAGSNAAALDATSRDKLRKSGLTSIAKALSDYFAANGSYPVSSASTKISTSQGLLYENLVPTYISALPLDPLPNSYYYGYMSTGISFTLSAALEVQTDADGTMTGGKNIYFLKSQ